MSQRGIGFAFSLACAIALRSVGAAAADEESSPSAPVVAPDSAGPAEASPSPEALIEQGIAFRENGDDRRALAAFERAWALGGPVRALAQLALAEQALGHWREAHEHLQNALKNDADPWISAHRGTLEGALQEIASRLGALEVTCNVAGAEVRLEGRVIGRTPLDGALLLLAGESVIQVSAQGYFDVARKVQVDAGGLARLDIILTSNSTSGGATAASPERGNAGEAAATTLARARAAEAASAHAGSERGHSTRDIFTYTSLGLAALGVTVGITGYVLREVNVKMYNDDSRCAQTQGVRRSDECADELAAWRRGESFAIAGVSAAGVFGLTALYLWLDRPTAAREASVACGIGAAAVRCSGQF